MIEVRERPCPVCGCASSSPFAHGHDYEYRTSANEWFFVRCDSCSTVYLNPIPVDLSATYPEGYGAHEAERFGGVVSFIHNLFELANFRVYRNLVPDPDARVLDLGCGGGRYMRLLHQVFPRWYFTGVDFSEKAIENVVATGYEGIAGDPAHIDFGRETFDLVVMNQFLEHVAEPRETLAKVFSELKPGGAVNIEMPSLGGWDFHVFRDEFYDIYHFPRHLTLFTPETLGRLLDSVGFEVYSVTFSPSPQVWVSSLHNVFSHHGWPGASFFTPSNPLALTPYMLVYWIEKLLTGRSSVMRVLARKPG